MRPAREPDFFVPEVIQTSLMDCGPAALKAVLQGFGIDVSYDWLRTRCQTDVDGTSIDALGTLATELGLRASEVPAARDTLLVREADCLPAIVLTRPAGGLLHFAVVWNAVGPFVQVMDPGSGRRWVRKEALLESLPLHSVPMTKTRWREWAGSEDHVLPLEARMRDLGLGRKARELLLGQAHDDGTWVTFSALDAAIRMTTALVRARAVARGGECARMTTTLVEDARASADPYEAIPAGFWWASPRDPETLDLRGIVLVHFERGDVVAAAGVQDPAASGRPPSTVSLPDLPGPGEALPPAVAKELARARVSALRLLFETARADAPHALGLLALTALVGSLVAGLDLVLLRGLFDVTHFLTVRYQRVGGVLALLPFTVGALVLQLYVGAFVARLGRALEMRLRVAVLEKLPRLDDAYLRSRPTSDMAARGHAIHVLRQAPALGARVAGTLASYVVTVAAIAWFEPSHALLAVGAAIVGLAVPYVIRKPLAESTMRLSTHAGALDRFYLDALTGAVPVRVHGAELALRREHESLLVEWARTARVVLAQSTWMRAAQACAGTALAGAIVGSYVAAGSPPARLLLLAFLAMQLPALGEQLVTLVVSSRATMNVALRLFAPLAGAESGVAAPVPDEEPRTTPEHGIGIALRGVTVRAGGHALLHDLDLDIAPGTHVALVGASGAGKSSLVSLLLGFLRASEGTVYVDREPLDDARLARLRRETVWVDPSVALWNRSLVDNLTFGAEPSAASRAAEAIDAADLAGVLEGLPDGLQTVLGERGSRLSGGQGQRVRLARGFLRGEVRLVVLDEPFRGLERDKRRALLRRARALWRGVTLLVVSHDVSDVLELDRALVIEDGAIVEDGVPSQLARTRGSRLRALARADAELREALFGGDEWRRLHLEDGRLIETSAILEEAS